MRARRRLAPVVGLLLLAATLAVGAAGRAPAATAALAKPAVPDAGAYLGAYVFPDRGQTGATAERDTEAFEQSIGRPLGFHDEFEKWADVGIGANQLADARAGRIPMLSWDCYTGTGGDKAIIDGSQDAVITQAAEQIKAYGHPIFVRWFWEMNLPGSSRNAKCLGGLGAVGYIRAWRHIHDIFTSVGATNAAFVWVVAGADVGGLADQFYPGDAYVDWVGQDGYSRTTIRPFTQLFADFYGEWAGRKPIMVGETGVAADPAGQAAWLAAMFAALPAQFPQIKAVSYEDARATYDYALTDTALTAFAAGGHQAYFRPVEAAQPLTLTGVRSLTLQPGAGVEEQVSTTGFPVPALRVEGTLPAGVTFHDDGDGTGVLTGTPKAGGSSALTVVAASAQGSVQASFVLAVGGAPRLLGSRLVQAAVGVPVSAPLTVSAYPPAAVTVTGLPAHFGYVGAAIVGAPAAGEGGAYTAVVTAKNPYGTATATVWVLVSEVPQVVGADAVAAYVGRPLHVALQAGGYPRPVLSVVGDRPPWLAVTDDGRYAVITGTPTTPGVSSLVLRATYGLAVTDYDLIVTVHS